jgi:glycine hydroxymethyltransferase
MHMHAMRQTDPELAALLEREAAEQRRTLSLVASENLVSPALREALASALVDRTVEGYPGRRFYAGCVNVDAVESLAISRAKALFGAEHANVQPHSGSQANFAVYQGLLQPGDSILSMNMAHGGHLTHGSPYSISGMVYRVSFYGVDRATEQIDYDQLAAQARALRPRLLIAGGSSYPRTLDFARLASIAQDAGALLLADTAHICGLVAAGVHPNPTPHADVVSMSTSKTLRGPRGGIVLCKAEHAERIDLGLFPGVQGSIHLHAVAAKALTLHEAAQPAFREYQRRVVANARALAAALQRQGLRLVTGGTDTHLMLVDLRALDIDGRAAERLLEAVGLHANRNGLPFDERPPHVGSGIRLGTPSVTSRGLGEAEMERLAELIATVLLRRDDPQAQAPVRAGVAELAEAFLPPL